MLEFALEAANRPFAVAIGLMLAIAVLEGVLALIGMGVSSFFDSLIPDPDVDLDGPQTDIQGSGPDVGDSIIGQTAPSSTNLPSRILGWLCIGKVPILILLVIFLLVFGVAGYVIQGIVSAIFGILIPGTIAWLPALIVAIPIVRVCGEGFAKIIPKDQTSAVESSTFVGRVATITLGTAKRGMPAQAKLTDQHGLVHYVMVEPESDTDEFGQGTSLLLIEQSGTNFIGVRNTSTALTDD